MISPDDTLVLAPSVSIIALTDLPAAVREQLGGAQARGFALTRRHGRTPSTLIDEAMAELLEEFRAPTTVVDAIIRYSRRLHLDAERSLTDAYPALRGCVRQGYLVIPGSEASRPIEVLFDEGSQVAGGVVVRCLHVVEDTEVHQLAVQGGGTAALKVLRPARSHLGPGALRREAEVLRRLGGRVAPRLLEEGETDGVPWLAMEWCDGVPLSSAAAGARAGPGADAALLALARRVTEAYAELHEAGVIHGDVHPGNILVSPEADVRVVDYGLARVAGSDERLPRGGVHALYDPQHAAAARAGRPPEPATFASDQYALGAVVYELVCGSPYLELSLQRDELLRQIVEDDPLPFAARGRSPWPEVEQVLGAALAKDPVQRLPSTREMALRLAVAAPSARAVRRARSEGLEQALDAVLRRAREGGAWFERGLPAGAPVSSVAYGAAGLAVALHRVAVLRADPELLALADEWSVRAERDAGRPDAFASEDLGVDERDTGQVSPFHRVSGVHAVQALISHARDDPTARQHALEAFVAASRHPCANLDLTLGRSGTLLAAALLHEAMSEARHADLRRLVELGNDTLRALWSELDEMPPVAEGTAVTFLGIAHGWAGMLLATLRWCRAAKVPAPATLTARLDELASLARPVGRGARWPLSVGQTGRGAAGSMAGWCHGSAGYVHLWTTAHAVLGGRIAGRRSPSRRPRTPGRGRTARRSCAAASAVRPTRCSRCTARPASAAGSSPRRSSPAARSRSRGRARAACGFRRACTRARSGSPCSPPTSAIRRRRACRSSGRRSDGRPRVGAAGPAREGSAAELTHGCRDPGVRVRARRLEAGQDACPVVLGLVLGELGLRVPPLGAQPERDDGVGHLATCRVTSFHVGIVGDPYQPAET